MTTGTGKNVLWTAAVLLQKYAGGRGKSIFAENVLAYYLAVIV